MIIVNEDNIVIINCLLNMQNYSFHLKSIDFTSIVISIITAVIMTTDLLFTYKHSYDMAVDSISKTVDTNIYKYGNKKQNESLQTRVKNLTSHLEFLKIDVFNSAKENKPIFTIGNIFAKNDTFIIEKNFIFGEERILIKIHIESSKTWHDISWILDKTIIFYLLIALLSIITINFCFYIFASKEIKKIAKITSDNIQNPNYDLSNLFFIDTNYDFGIIKENFNFLSIKLRVQQNDNLKKLKALKKEGSVSQNDTYEPSSLI